MGPPNRTPHQRGSSSGRGAKAEIALTSTAAQAAYQPIDPSQCKLAGSGALRLLVTEVYASHDLTFNWVLC